MNLNSNWDLQMHNFCAFSLLFFQKKGFFCSCSRSSIWNAHLHFQTGVLRGFFTSFDFRGVNLLTALRKLLLGGEHDAVDGRVLLLATDHRVQEPFERRSVEGPQQSRHFLPAKRDDLHRQLVVAILERDGEDVVAQVRCPGVLRQRQLLVVGRAADLDEDVGSDAEERVRQIVLVQRFQIGLKRIGSNFTLISSILRSRYSVILPK